MSVHWAWRRSSITLVKRVLFAIGPIYHHREAGVFPVLSTGADTSIAHRPRVVDKDGITIGTLNAPLAVKPSTRPDGWVRIQPVVNAG